jgi:transcriptional regulator with XRE-family HTH domain
LQGLFVKNNSLIGNFLKEERKRLGLSQAEAAEKCGISREIWGKYERGITMPGSEALYAFAHSGADMQYVFTGVRSSLSLSAIERLFLEKLRASTSAQQDQALRTLLGEQTIAPKFNVEGNVGNQFENNYGGITIDKRGKK